MITNSGYCDHSKPLFIGVEILQVDNIQKYLCCVYVFRSKKRYALKQNDYITRNCNQLRIQFQRLSTSQISMFYSAPIFFNEFADHVASLNKFVTFKRRVKDFFFIARSIQCFLRFVVYLFQLIIYFCSGYFEGQHLAISPLTCADFCLLFILIWYV